MKKESMKKDMVDDLAEQMEAKELPKRIIISEMLDAETVKVPEKKGK